MNDFFCHICALGKFTHHVPLLHDTPHMSKRRRLDIEHATSADDTVNAQDAAHDDTYINVNIRCRSTQPFEIMYSDVSGIVPVSSIGESHYYVIFIHDFTRMTWILFIKEKGDTAKAIHDFVIKTERQHKKKVKHLFTDNGGEYVN